MRLFRLSPAMEAYVNGALAFASSGTPLTAPRPDPATLTSEERAVLEKMIDPLVNRAATGFTWSP